MRVLIVPCLFLAACNQPAPPIVGAVDPCPVYASAEPEKAPEKPILTEQQQLAVDTALIGVLGASLASILIRHTDVDLPGFAERQSERVSQTAEWCQSR
jgi:hypothetical protein